MNGNPEPVLLMKGPIATLKDAAQTLENAGVQSTELLRPGDCFGSS